MTIKTLRKGYENLTMLQRLALADNAMARDDDSEARAIKAASPRVGYTHPDFWETFEKITNIRMCNLIVRLGYMMSFDFFSIRELEELNDKSVSASGKRLDNDLRMAAFLYVRTTDCWNALNDELSLQPNFDATLGTLLLSIDLFKAKDAVMRAYAFSEDEARKHIFEQTGNNSCKTAKEEIKALKEYLEIK